MNKRHLIIITICVLNTIDVLANLSFDERRLEYKVSDFTKDLEFTYKVKNDGSYPVKIISVDSSCSCTSVVFEKAQYEPNDIGEIKGVFTVGERSGKNEIIFIVKTDDLTQPEITLSLNVAIINEMEVSPKLLLWKKGSSSVAKSFKLKFANFSHSENFEIKCNDENFILKEKSVENSELERTFEIMPISTYEKVQSSIDIIIKSKNLKIKTYKIFLLIK